MNQRGEHRETRGIDKPENWRNGEGEKISNVKDMMLDAGFRILDF